MFKNFKSRTSKNEFFRFINKPGRLPAVVTISFLLGCLSGFQFEKESWRQRLKGGLLMAYPSGTSDNYYRAIDRLYAGLVRAEVGGELERICLCTEGQELYCLPERRIGPGCSEVFAGIAYQAPSLDSGHNIIALLSTRRLLAVSISWGLVFSLLGLGVYILNSRLFFYEIAATQSQRKLEQLSRRSIELRQIAHDIRSPAGALTALVQAAVGLTDSERSFVNVVVKRINAIADSLLKESKAKLNEEGESCDLILTINECVKEVRMSSVGRQQCEFTVKSESGQAYARIEPNYFARSISNLLVNSIEAGAEHVNIELRTTETSITITIVDDAGGFEPDVLTKLLSGNETTTKENGNGIGILGAKRMIESSGGELTFGNEKSGARFTVKLNRAA